ncbi:MAG: adenylosuccinate synthetase [Conexivisphaerales archaeon]
MSELNTSVIGLQWGDEGKGKIVDYLSADCSAVVRFNGGSNAGHTVVVDGKRYVFHMLPSGAASKKELILASGVAVDPSILGEEIRNLPHSVRVLVDLRCSLVTPMDREMDVLIEEKRGAAAIGTTKRGIGPSYAMRALRLQPRVCDVLSSDFDVHSLLGFYEMLGIKKNVEPWTEEARNVLKGIAGDSGEEVIALNERGERVLFEGSQGSLLDIIHGSYPHVTSSHTLSTYIPVSLGLGSDVAGRVVGVMKCYTTRVGAGAFPTEVHGQAAEAIRAEGKEYGATTGRPRRIGWLDFVSLKYAAKINGVDEIAITKLDVLAKFRQVKVCRRYVIDGREVSDFSEALPLLSHAVAISEEVESFHSYDFSAGVGGSVAKFVQLVEDELNVPVRLLSYGEERVKTIELS